MMKVIGKLAIAASAVLWISAAAAQDGETTTTTRTTRDAPLPPGVYVGVPGVAGVQICPGAGYQGGCEHHSKKVANEATGDTMSKSETWC
jgi:hypothetical protein